MRSPFNEREGHHASETKPSYEPSVRIRRCAREAEDYNPSCHRNRCGAVIQAGSIVAG
jgi:hypothetical protein